MSNNAIKVIFLGTPVFSVPILEALIADPSIEILVVVTPPDKPAGRGQNLTPPAIKKRAEEAGLTVYQTKSIRKDETLQKTLDNLNPDFFVTIAFGQILSQEVLDIPKLGTVNVHASLLPELRGANPIQWAILHNKTQTGITTMLTDIGVDTGDMLLKEMIEIAPDDTLLSLTIKLSQAGGPLLIKTLKGMASGSITPEAQDHDASTHAPKCDKNADIIDWEKDAQTVHNQIRAFNAGVAFLQMPDGSQQRMKLSDSRISEENLKTATPGQVLGNIKAADDSVCLHIATGNGAVSITRIQPDGKRAMPVSDWLNGIGLQAEQLRFLPSSTLTLR